MAENTRLRDIYGLPADYAWPQDVTSAPYMDVRSLPPEMLVGLAPAELDPASPAIAQAAVDSLGLPMPQPPKPQSNPLLDVMRDGLQYGAMLPGLSGIPKLIPIGRDYSEAPDPYKSYLAATGQFASTAARGIQTLAESAAKRTPMQALEAVAKYVGPAPAAVRTLKPESTVGAVDPSSLWSQGANKVADVFKTAADVTKERAEAPDLRVDSTKHWADVKNTRTAAEYVLNTFGTAAGSIVPLIATSVATGAYGTVPLLGSLGVGSIRNAFDEAGVDWSQNEDVLYPAAAVYASLEYIPGVSAVKSLLRGEAKEAFDRSIMQAVLKGFVRGGSREGATEALQRATEITSAIYAQTRDAGKAIGASWDDVLKGTDSTIIASGIDGWVGGGPFSAAGRGAQRAQQVPQQPPPVPGQETGQPQGLQAPVSGVPPMVSEVPATGLPTGQPGTDFDRIVAEDPQLAEWLRSMEQQPAPVVRPDPVFDQDAWQEAYRLGTAPAPGEPVVSATVFAERNPAGEPGIKTLSINGETVAAATVNRDTDGNLVITRVDTLPGARRQGYATQLVDDLLEEFPGARIATSAQTDVGRPFFARYATQDGTLAPRDSQEPLYAIDGRRDQDEEVGQDNPAEWDQAVEQDLRSERGRGQDGRRSRTETDPAEQETRRIMREAASFETSLRQQGLPVEAIAAEMSRRYNSPVTAAAVQSGETWWSVGQESERFWTPERSRRLGQLYRENKLGPAEIAATLTEDAGRVVTPAAVTARRRNLSIPANRFAWTPEARDQLRSMTEARVKVWDIARRLSDEFGANLTPQAIRHQVSLMGLSRSRVAPPAEDISLMRREGRSVQDIAAGLSRRLGRGVSPSQVARVIAKGNIAAKVNPNQEAILEALGNPDIAALSNPDAAAVLSDQFNRPISRYAVSRARQQLRRRAERDLDQTDNEPMYAIGSWRDWFGLGETNGQDQANMGRPGRDGEVVQSVEGRGQEPAGGQPGTEETAQGGQNRRLSRRAESRARRVPVRGGTAFVAERVRPDGLRERSYYVYSPRTVAMADAGASVEGVPESFLRGSIGNWWSRAKIVEQPDGSWRLREARTRRDRRGQGLGTDLHRSIEADVAAGLLPQREMTADDYRWWRQRDPEAVRGYVKFDEMFYDPAVLREMKLAVDQIALTPILQSMTTAEKREIRAAQREAAALAKILPDTASLDDSEPLFAIGDAPDMRDLDSLGFYSKALEAAKSLPDSAPGPDMLGLLREAGVKDAEIVTTKLDQLLVGRPLAEYDAESNVRPDVSNDAARLKELGEKIKTASGSERQALIRERQAISQRIKSGSTTALESDAITLSQNPLRDMIAATQQSISTAREAITKELAKPNPRLTVTKGKVTHVLTRGTYGDGAFRITRMMDGEPIGHSDFKNTPEDITRAAQEMSVRPQQQGDRTASPPRRALLKQITKAEIVKHLEENRVGLREVVRTPQGYDDIRAIYGRNRDVQQQAIADARGNPALSRVARESDEAQFLRELGRIATGGPPSRMTDIRGTRRAEYDAARRHIAAIRASREVAQTQTGELARAQERTTKWEQHSLDPSNPTYRETVIHLPSNAGRDAAMQQAVTLRQQLTDAIMRGDTATADDLSARLEALDQNAKLRSGNSSLDFTSGHFSEPNIIGHMMTSMTRHEGKPVYTIDQIQDDWSEEIVKRTRNAVAQKLFGREFKSLDGDGRKAVSAEIAAMAQRGEKPAGVRDEAKIAELKAAMLRSEEDAKPLLATAKTIIDEYLGQANETNKKHWTEATNRFGARNFSDMPIEYVADFVKRAQTPEADAASASLKKNIEDFKLAQAELRTAEAATPGHPLVNTTDQWTQTTLRRAIRQAVEAGAEYIAIPHGDTVLSYNPGGEDGMRGFYGTRTSEGIVPKNLRKLLGAIDKAAAAPVRVEKLETSQGLQGWQNDMGVGATVGPRNGADVTQTGFTLFPLTDKVRQSVMEEGQPMFAIGRDRAMANLHNGIPVTIDLETRTAAHDALAPHLGIAPAMSVGVLKKIIPGDSMMLRGKPTKATTMIGERADGSEFSIDIPLSTLSRLRGALFFARDVSDGRDTVLVFPFGSTESFGKTFGGIMWHEAGVHGLRRLGGLDRVWARLLAHADLLDVKNLKFGKYVEMVSIPNADKTDPRTLEEIYTTLYEGRPNFKGLIEEESVAHMMEAMVHGAYTAEQMAPIQDIIDDIASGKLAREGEAKKEARARAAGHLPSKFYHGTSKKIPFTKGFYDPRRSDSKSPYEGGGHHGRAVYISSSRKDASDNYQGGGPDLTSRIVARYEDIAGREEIKDLTVEQRSRGLKGFRRAVKEGNLPPYLQNIDTDDKVAFGLAYEQLHGGKSTLLELRANPKNPVILEDSEYGKATFFPLERAAYGVEQSGDAWVVKDSDGDVESTHETESAAYDRADQLMSETEPTGPAARIVDILMGHSDPAVRSLGSDVSVYAWENEGISAAELERMVRGSDAMMDLFDDDGRMVSPGQFIQDLYVAIGHDGVIMPNADKQFARMGIEPGTAHIALFDRTRTRLASAKFDPSRVDEPDLLAALDRDNQGIPSTPGLDMSKEAKLARAESMGFDTSRIAYRGISRAYDPSKAGYYQMFTSNRAESGEYAMQYPNASPNVIAAFLRKGKNLTVNARGANFNGVPTAGLPADILGRLRGGVARTDEIAHAAREAGYDSVTIENVYDNATNEKTPARPSNPQMEAKRKAELDAILEELGIEDVAATAANAPPKGYEGVSDSQRGTVTIDAI